MENPGVGKKGGNTHISWMLCGKSRSWEGVGGNTHMGWMLCGKSRSWEEGGGGGGTQVLGRGGGVAHTQVGCCVENPDVRKRGAWG